MDILTKKRRIFRKKTIFYLFAACFSSSGYTQPAPDVYFSSPIDTAILLTGNFGEIRPNHFHAGLDIRTNNKEGKNILAVADGYVSRIKISGYGYGKALYITHPNGYVTVYAHLKVFNEKIGSYVMKEHYQRELFEIDLLPAPGELPVKKGEVIAFSGNTGSSNGPHLHFEVRSAQTEVAINPLLFSIDVKDSSPPVIQSLYVYKFLDSVFQESACDRNTLPKKYPAVGKNGMYTLKGNPILLLYPNSGFGIDVFDRQNGTMNKNGVYSIELRIDGQRSFYQVMDSVAFDETRYMNSHIDYFEQKSKSNNVQKSFVARNNKLRIYQYIRDQGIINFSDTLIHTAEYRIKDFHGNTSTLSFPVKKNPLPPDTLPVSCIMTLSCKKSNRFMRDDIIIDFSENCFYEDLKFDFNRVKTTLAGSFSPLYKIHNRYVPVHDYYSLSIKAENVPENMREKALIASINGKNSKTSEGGQWKDGFITTRTRAFGDFAVFADTLPPGIKPLNIKEGKYMGHEKEIRISVWDNLSGIKSYRGTIDGKWILMEHDPKKALLFYTFDERVGPGKHVFKLELTDYKNNTRFVETGFVR